MSDSKTVCGVSICQVRAVCRNPSQLPGPAGGGPQSEMSGDCSPTALLDLDAARLASAPLDHAVEWVLAAAQARLAREREAMQRRVDEYTMQVPRSPARARLLFPGQG